MELVGEGPTVALSFWVKNLHARRKSLRVHIGWEAGARKGLFTTGSRPALKPI
jgi:hypothetical protein